MKLFSLKTAKKALVAGAIGATLLSSGAYAAGKSKKADDADGFKKIEIVKDSLPNGLVCFYNVDKSAPVVCTVLHYRVGSRYESAGKTGYAHFFEHLMFEGTESISRATVDKYAEEAGGELNAHTSFDETVFFFQMPSNELQLPLWIESQRIRKLLVDSIGIETQRGVVKEELKNRYDNQPYGAWMMKMFANLFPNSQYSWTPIGSIADLNKASRNDFVEFYNTYYQPSNATLVISGDFEIAKVKELVRDYFGQYPNKAIPAAPKTNVEPLTKEYRETIEDDKAQMPLVFVGYQGPSLTDPDYYAANLLTSILASGESSRMYQQLVDKDKIAVEAQCEAFSLEKAGALILIGMPSPGKEVKDVEEGMYAEIEKVIKTGVTDEEFTKAMNIKEVEFISGKKDVQEKAMEIAKLYSYFGDANVINTELDNYSKVKKEDLQRVAKKYFSTKNRVVLTFVPKKGE